MRIILTRPAAQAGPWLRALRQAGLDVVSLPLIHILPPQDPQPLRQAWGQLEDTALVFFVSANAALHFFAERPAGLVWPAGTLAAAPGPGTAQALLDQGVPAACVVTPAADAAQFDSEAVWALLAGRHWAGRQVLVLRGEAGRNWLADQFEAAGARLRFVTTYRRRPPEFDAADLTLVRAAAAAPQQHVWCFSSSEAVQHLRALAPQACQGAPALATHPRIAQAAREAGFEPVLSCAPPLADVSLALRGLVAGATPGRQAAPAQDAAAPDAVGAKPASVQSRTL